MQEEEIKRLVSLTKQPIKNIQTTEAETIIEFENGETIQLSGGRKMVNNTPQLACCSYCGTVRSKENPMISPDDKPNILICSKCTVQALELFVKSGLEIELELSFLTKDIYRKK